MAFQLLFLVIYDLFLKRETFFEGNRLYLIATFLLAMVLPQIKIGAFRTTVPNGFAPYPEYLWGRELDSEVIIANGSRMPDFGWPEILIYGGMVMAALLFGYKLFQIYGLRTKGEVRYFPRFTRVVLERSNIAFSFFRTIFLGDEVLKKEHESIIEHELVHIEQGHSWDLLLFELARVAMWFNPLVYVYQARISELHEFIADAKVAKTHKREQYEILLSQIFDTQHISFINPFFKSSLIKKRIVMLQKTESKKIWQLKYLFLIPVVVGLLFYTSCEIYRTGTATVEEEGSQDIKGSEMSQKVMPDKAAEEEIQDIRASTTLDDALMLPFATVEEVPIFPGCADAVDKRACFNEKMQEHIVKNFRYPKEAQEKGIQGTAMGMFTIAPDGTIQNIRKRGPDPLLEAEVVRIISLLPEMEPGKQQGKNVAVPFSIPIDFKLSDDLVIAANDKSEVLAIPFSEVDEVPLFPGCADAVDKRACFNEKMQEHIAKNFRYPKEAQEKGIQGKVAAIFTIAPDGTIRNIKKRGPDPMLEAEVTRIISLLPQMEPGKKEGSKVAVAYSIPVHFALK
jgi:TonB family protein